MQPQLSSIPSAKSRPALRLIDTRQLPRDEWLAVRKQGIGSSDAAAAVGLNPYKSPLELWLEKTGRDAGLPHPFDEVLRKEQGGKIRSIPIRVLFNDPDLNFRAEYSLFDRDTGRPLCVGNGETCKRWSENGIQSLPCPAPEACAVAVGKNCKPYGRLNVLIGDDDPLGSFVFRTTGFNSIRALTARLQYFRAVSGDRLASLPLELKLRGKSTRQSHGAPIYYVDITVRSGMTLEDALLDARRVAEQRQKSGFDQTALDTAARQGLGNGAFEEGDEEGAEVVEEFFPVESPESDGNGQDAGVSSMANGKASLAERLEQMEGAV